MYTFMIGAIQVTSSAATMCVPWHGDWLDDVDAGTEHARPATGPHDARLLDAPVSDAAALARYLETVHTGVTAERFLNAMRMRGYAWGELVALNWTALGFAPGGVSHFLLPHDLPCVDLGGLALDWSTLDVSLRNSRVPFKP